MSERVGLLGGSFNPIHFGHLITARAVAEALELSRVLLIPCARPPHKWPHELASMAHRLQMALLATADEPRLEVSDVEGRQDRPHYPIHAIEALRQEAGASSQLHWIIGSDTVSDLCHWHRLSDMLEACEIAVAVRAGVESPDLSSLEGILAPPQIERLRGGCVSTPRVEISATQIRERIRRRQSIRYLAPDAVCDYIDDWGLYLARGE